MKSLMVSVFFLFIIQLISCEVYDASDYSDSSAFTEHEQIGDEAVDQTVNQNSEASETNDVNQTESQECITNGGRAGDTGLKVWCWEDITLPVYTNSKGVSFSNKELVIDSECYEQQVSKSGNKLRFRVNPLGPEIGSWCSNNFNMRAEIRTAPWQVRNELGTEEWFGWSYEFGDTYIIDQNNQWKFFQVYPGTASGGPQISLEVIHGDQFNGHAAGEIYVVNKAGTGDKKYASTGITPLAGQAFDVVVHVIWGDNLKGLLQVWINNEVVYDEQIATVTSDAPWGGNAKWGIYKWPWRDEARVQKSLNQGITHLETYLGAIRMITRKPEDVNYGKNSYSEVSPQ